MLRKVIKTLVLVLAGAGLAALTGCSGGGDSNYTITRNEQAQTTTGDYYGIPQAKLMLSATTPLNPFNGQINVNQATTIRVTFNTNINPATLNAANFRVERAFDNALVPGNFAINGLTAVFTPTPNLQALTQYRVIVGLQLKSSTGGSLTKDLTYTFTTGVLADNSAPTLNNTYTALDNNAIGGPPAGFEDIAATGTLVPPFPNIDDSFVGPIALPFVYDWYGYAASNFFVSTNGYITINAGSSQFSAPGFPSASPPVPLFAPYFSDLYVDGTGKVLYETRGVAPNRRLIVQYENVQSCCNSAFPRGTFQVILYENSPQVLFQYKDMAAFGNGTGGTVGVNRGNGIIGTQYSYFTASLAPNRAILFTEQIALLPLPNAGGVAKGTTAQATFSKPIAPGTIVTPATRFTVVRNSDNLPVAGTVSLDVIGTIATFTPVAPLDPTTTYRATITTGVTDFTGLPLDHQIVWTFTTGL